MKIIAPFGFFGAGNIGDESTLQGFARLVSERGNGFRVWVASRNPSHTARVEPSFRYYNSRGRDLRRRWARFRSSAQVIVGGTPIMDVLGAWPLSELSPIVRSAGAERKPVVFVGAGTESLQNEQSKRVVSESLIPHVRHWTVRSNRDKERLIGYGADADSVTVAADLAWLLEPQSTEFGARYLKELGLVPSRPLIGVNLANELNALDQQPHLLRELVTFLDWAVEKFDAQIAFFANEVREHNSFDTAANRKVLGSLKNRDSARMVPSRYWSPQEMISLIGCCELTISMRYHFCLFSALQNVPFIALQRSTKISDLCWDLNWSYCADFKDLNANVLLEMLCEVNANRSSLVVGLRRQVESLRERAKLNRIALDSLVRVIGNE